MEYQKVDRETKDRFKSETYIKREKKFQEKRKVLITLYYRNEIC